MAVVKLFKLGPNGVPRQHNTSADDIEFLSVKGGNLKMSGNVLSSENTDGNIDLNPNGTGLVQINGSYTLPNSDGTVGQVLATNGAGTVDFIDPDSAAKICTVYNSAAGVGDRAAVYISGANDVDAADASVESSARVIGFADGAISAAGSGPICHDGVLDGFVGLTPGARYFLTDIGNGSISSTPPNDDEHAIIQVGYAKSTTELHVDIEVILEIETD